MTQIQKALQNKIEEREHTINLFASVPPRASFEEIREFDYEIAGLQRLVEQEQRTTNQGGVKPSVRS
jgi:hypothetical protein